MKIEKFEDILAWRKAKELTLEIYKIFDKSKDFGFKNQILRASVSIMNNIAEGYERKGDKEFEISLYFKSFLRRSQINALLGHWFKLCE